VLCLRGARGRAGAGLRVLPVGLFEATGSVCSGLSSISDSAENELDPQSVSPVLAGSTISPVVVPSVERAPSTRAASSRELLAALRAIPVSMFTTRRPSRRDRALGAGGVKLTVAFVSALRD
jgi:hypothetical protein